MIITRTSIFTGKANRMDLPVTDAQLSQWENGELIQRAMPRLTAAQREFIMTGVTSEEWAEHIGTDDEDEEKAVTWTKTEDGYCQEASCLGLVPGRSPGAMVVHGTQLNQRWVPCCRDGETTHWTQFMNGVKYTIFND